MSATPAHHSFDLVDFYGLKVPDSLGLMYGHKKIISTGLEPRMLPSLKKTFARYGLTFRALDSLHDSRGRSDTYIIAREARYLEEANEAYRKNRFDLVGALLGYPPCCVKSFLRRLRDRSTDDFVRLAAGAGDSFFWQINNILDFDGRIIGAKAAAADFSGHRQVSLISHNPCSYGCRPSLELARRTLALIERHRRPAREDKGYATLGKPALYLDDFRFAILDGASCGNSVSYTGIDLSMGLGSLRDTLLKGDKVSVAGKRLTVLRKEKPLLAASFRACPLILPFDRPVAS